MFRGVRGEEAGSEMGDSSRRGITSMTDTLFVKMFHFAFPSCCVLMAYERSEAWVYAEEFQRRKHFVIL